jgi:Bacterial Ig domain
VGPKPILVVLLLFVVPAVVFGQCVPSGIAGTVNICTPAANATVGSPVTVQAAASPIAGRTVTSMRLYVDNVSTYTTFANTLSTSPSMAAGAHNLVVNSWDNTGAVYQAKETITVGTTAGCTASASTVKICAPAPGSTVASPVTFQAASAAPSGQTITAMKLYVDGVSKFQSANGTLQTSLALASGAHAITIHAWTNTGTVLSASESITVGGGGVGVTVSPTSATVSAGATKQFTATVTGSTNTAVTWSVDGIVGGSAAGGTITSTGVYAAPSSAGSHTVTATSQADSTKSANAAVTVSSTFTCTAAAGTVKICQPAAGATVTSPVAIDAAATAASGQTITAMKVYIDNVSQFLTNSGHLQTSLTIAAGTHSLVVNAWSNTGVVTKSGETITVTTGAGVTISPTSSTVGLNGTQQFTATVTGFADTSVSWSVDGAAGGNATVGTISTAGLYTAPGTAGTHTVKAAANADTTKSASATVTVESAPPPSSNGVFTYMNDNNRTGLNDSETKLTLAAVTNGANFGFKNKVTLDGQIQTQPLFVPNVNVGTGTFNVVYVATENDSVYALNADNPTQVLWKKNLLPSGATIGRSYSCSGSACDGRTGLGANIGVTGTPVIDPSLNRLYVVAKSTENTAQVYRLHALDLRTGQDVMGSAIVQGTVTGSGAGSANGTLQFNALTHNQRPGLALQNGVLYIGFASYSDFTPYHGWLIAYSASDFSYLGAWASTPDTDGGGIWSSGAAPAVDSNGNVYIGTGNQMPYASAFPAIPGEIPNSVVKLKLVGSNLELVDYFVPYNTKCLTNDDLDVASSSPVLIPTPFAGHNMLSISSKEGRVYLVDADNMGKFHSGSDSQILDSKLFNPTACGQTGFQADYPLRVYGIPAYWNGNIYFGPVFGPLRQYNITGATLNQVALGTHEYVPFSSASTAGQSVRGPLTIVSSNGTSNAIVWTAEDDTSGNGWIRAYDATNVSKQLYNVNFGPASHFIIPTVANGNLYVTGHATLYMYGTLR